MKINPKQLEIGTKVEMEHTDDVKLARKIALDHLREIPDYYTRLLKMEREAGIVNGDLVRAQMPEKEIIEARHARIPEEIIAKMSQGLGLSEREKSVVRKHGKVYVPAFRKAGILFRPHIRKLSNKEGKKPKYFINR